MNKGFPSVSSTRRAAVAAANGRPAIFVLRSTASVGLRRTNSTLAQLAAAAEARQQVCQWLVRRQITTAERADDKERRIRSLCSSCTWRHGAHRAGMAQKKVQPFDTLPVTPLQVVDNQQQGLVADKQRSRQRLKQTLALPDLGHRSKSRKVRMSEAQFRQQPRNLCQPNRIQLWQQLLHRWRPQPGDHRRIGQGAFCRVTAGDGRGIVLPFCPDEQFLDQPGLPDARFPGYHRQMS